MGQDFLERHALAEDVVGREVDTTGRRQLASFGIGAPHCKRELGKTYSREVPWQQQGICRRGVGLPHSVDRKLLAKV